VAKYIGIIFFFDRDSQMTTLSAIPLEKYSSLHKVSLLKLPGINISPAYTFIFNLQTTPLPGIRSQLIFSLRDCSAAPILENPDYCINNLTRWRLNLAAYSSFDDFLQKIKRSHFRKYRETLKTFAHYGTTLSLIEDDWSQHADVVYQLYLKVAKRHGKALYDLNFFRTIAKLKEYKLLCVWREDAIVSALVIIDEEPVLHSMVCCLDYEHSKKCHAYSRMHYELIRLGIESKKYAMIDIGLTADKAKSLMDFQPISSRMDIYAQNVMLKAILRMLSRFTMATINEQSKFELSFSLTRNK
jgi:predicted N-acyltransferase